MLKVKNLMLLLTLPKKVITRKNIFYYDKANYIFSYVKDVDNDSESGLSEVSNEALYFEEKTVF